MELFLGWRLLSAQLPGCACSGVVSVPCGTQRNHRNHRNLRSPHRERELKEVLKGNLRGVGALLGVQKQKEKLNE